jgi:hypothetical protein
MPSETLRASELATFAFCQRAWHYARSGAPSDNLDYLHQGTVWHTQIERRTRRSIWLLRIGAALIMGGAALVLYGLVLV